MARRQSRARTTQDATVRGEYSSGTGFGAGQVAPSTKYVNEDGKVVDEEPTGAFRVLIAEGDVVREHMLPALESQESQALGTMRYDNEHSSGDASHSLETRAPDLADGTTTGDAGDAGAGTSGDS